MTKQEIFENALSLLQSSFVDDNYDETNIDQLENDTIEFICDECEDYGVEFTFDEVATFVKNNL